MNRNGSIRSGKFDLKLNLKIFELAKISKNTQHSRDHSIIKPLLVYLRRNVSVMAACHKFLK